MLLICCNGTLSFLCDSFFWKTLVKSFHSLTFITIGSSRYCISRYDGKTSRFPLLTFCVQGGFFWGSLQFPADYPMKPPAIRMFTPSGRFITNVRICLSISDFHPESWSPLWNIGTILTGLVSFMCDNSPTHGSLETSDARRRMLAARSLEFNQRDPLFAELFPDIVEEFNRRYPPTPTVVRAASSSQSTRADDDDNDNNNNDDNGAAVADDAQQQQQPPPPPPPPTAAAAPVAPVVAGGAVGGAVANKPRPTVRAADNPGATPIADALTYIALVLALIFGARFAGIININMNVGWN
jgi:hypothetical protein